MAEKTGKGGVKGPIGYDAALRQIKTGQIQPVYLLYGEETYLQDRFLDELKKAWLRGEADAFNTNREDGRNMTQAQVVDLACQLPFWADRKLVLIEEPAFIPCGKEQDKGKADPGDQDSEGDSQDGGAGSAEEALASGKAPGKKKAANSSAAGAQPVLLSYLAQPSPSTCLVLRCGQGKPDRRNKLVTEIAKLEGLVEAAALSPMEILPYLQKALQETGKECHQSLLEQIARQPGGLRFCLQELEKVIAYAGTETKIMPDMLKAVLTPSLEANIFRMVDALGQRRRPQALQELRLLLASGQSPYAVFAMMLRQFRLIFRAKACLQAGMAKGQIAQVLGLPPFVADKTASQSKQYSFAELEKAMDVFLNKDLAMKSSAPPAQVLEDLVIALAS